MLKLFAAIIMLIDHIGYLFGRWMPPELERLMRTVGRLAFPIFAWYAAAGFIRTRNVYRYFLRLTVFAIISEAIFFAGFSIAGIRHSGTNVLFTFMAALAFMTGFELATRSILDMIGRLELLPEARIGEDGSFQVRLNTLGYSLPSWLGLLLGLIIALLACIFTILIDSDYGLYGIFTVFAFYLGQKTAKTTPTRRFSVTLFLIIFVNAAFYLIQNYVTNSYFADIQLFSVLAVPLIFLWPEERQGQRQRVRLFFYVFYPLHIFVLLMIVFLIKSL